jgi:hypothetical protein
LILPTKNFSGKGLTTIRKQAGTYARLIRKLAKEISVGNEATNPNEQSTGSND